MLSIHVGLSLENGPEKHGPAQAATSSSCTEQREYVQWILLHKFWLKKHKFCRSAASFEVDYTATVQELLACAYNCRSLDLALSTCRTTFFKGGGGGGGKFSKKIGLGDRNVRMSHTN